MIRARLLIVDFSGDSNRTHSVRLIPIRQATNPYQGCHHHSDIVAVVVVNPPLFSKHIAISDGNVVEAKQQEPNQLPGMERRNSRIAKGRRAAKIGSESRLST